MPRSKLRMHHDRRSRAARLCCHPQAPQSRHVCVAADGSKEAKQALSWVVQNVFRPETDYLDLISVATLTEPAVSVPEKAWQKPLIQNRRAHSLARAPGTAERKLLDATSCGFLYGRCHITVDTSSGEGRGELHREAAGSSEHRQ